MPQIPMSMVIRGPMELMLPLITEVPQTTHRQIIMTLKAMSIRIQGKRVTIITVTIPEAPTMMVHQEAIRVMMNKLGGAL